MKGAPIKGGYAAESRHGQGLLQNTYSKIRRDQARVIGDEKFVDRKKICHRIFTGVQHRAEIPEACSASYQKPILPKYKTSFGHHTQLPLV